MSESIVIPVIFFTLFLVIRTISNNNLRKKMLDRGISHEDMKQLFENVEQTSKAGFAPLKFGLICIIVGLSFLVIESLQLSNEVGSAVIFIAVGLVLVTFSRIDRMKK